MEVQELPDYKAYRSEIDKYIDEPLLEYIWLVANKFLPVVDEDGCSESQAPIIFANRWIESNMTTEERHARFLEFFPNNTQEDIEQYYNERPLLDTTFRETFFEKEEVLQTLFQALNHSARLQKCRVCLVNNITVFRQRY